MDFRPFDVLIVEDDVVVLESIRAVLGVAGFTLMRTGRTLAEGLAETERRTPDGAIIDGNLADGSNGLDLVARLSALGAPCLVISGHLMRDDALSAGARTFLPKPFTETQLLNHVTGLFQARDVTE
ncbi:response regulator [Azospirillum canadense]|uniref:response regulator n=1 Tax=Azospirillum canadense TaxID=403962 RepID=UPI0022268D95|nr:response regulator [Azospirillum canadense]MCW2240282.1 DNA-binding response OmpR family regulator [Azospirillum canadense]